MTFYTLVCLSLVFCQFFASMLQEQLFELKTEDTIKKSENLLDTCAC